MFYEKKNMKKFNLSEYSEKRGQNELFTSATTTRLHWLVWNLITKDYLESERETDLKGPNGEHVYISSERYICEITNKPDWFYVRDMGSSQYISSLTRKCNFGTIYICRYGKWFSVTNHGGIEGRGTKQWGTIKWWILEVHDLTDQELKALPEDLINCPKTKDDFAIAYFK